jgi:hypothetical protein
MMITGELRNWKWDKNHSIIWGHVYNDARKRFPDGTWIHTSWIDKAQFANVKEGDTVKTLNSEYLLRNKADV